MQAHILIVNGTDKYKYLQNMLEKENKIYSFEIVSYKKLRHIWNKLTKKNFLLVVSNYLIENSEDALTVIRFLKSFDNKPQAKFYSPRPNQYLQTIDVCLWGTNQQTIWRKQTLGRKIVFLLKKYIEMLPFSIKNKLKNLKKKFKLKYSSIKSGDKELNKSLIIPSSLLELNPSCSWIEWIDSIALNRDLIDRCHLYYPHPVSIHIAVSNRCNLKCEMCPYHSPIYKAHHKTGFFDKEKMLNLETFHKIANYAGKNKISLQFGQIEEPLLHPHIFDFISLAKKKGVPYIHLTTNGTLLTKEKAIALAYSGVDSVMFSIDALEAETYRKIRGSNLENLEKKIDYFIPIAKKNRIRIICSFIRQPISFNQSDGFIQKWKMKGVDGVTFYVLSEHDLKNGEVIRYENFRQEFNRYPCASPWIQSVIMPDGSVGVCCKTMTDIGWKLTSVGNINDKDFEEIWLGNRYKKLRQELLNAKFEDFTICINCQIWSASTYEREIGNGYIKVFNETMETISFI